MSMITGDIDYAASNLKGHPVLGPASRFLQLLCEYVNGHSDGWSYCEPARTAAKELMDLIKKNTTPNFYPSMGSKDLKIEDFEATLPAIRRMARTQKTKQAKYGNTFDIDVDKFLRIAMTKNRFNRVDVERLIAARCNRLSDAQLVTVFDSLFVGQLTVMEDGVFGHISNSTDPTPKSI